MITAILLVQAATAPQITTRPLENERAAAEAFDAHLVCLGTEAFERAGDTREVDLLSTEVIDACSETATTLQGEIEDVYLRKPELKPDGVSSLQAAQEYVAVINRSIPVVLEDARERNVGARDSNDRP